MLHRHTSLTPRLGSFISKVITPVVLVGGVLFLLYFNFHSVLKASQDASTQFKGDVAFSQGAFSYRFQENAGIDRPALRYGTQDILSYAEWSSVVSVDGDVQELWNNYHGYDVGNDKRQVYSTTSNNDWQLMETVTLVNDHTVTVTFQFTKRFLATASDPGPLHFVFDIAHTLSSGQWYNYQVGSGTFNAQVLSGNGIPDNANPAAVGKISLSATGDVSPTPAITVKSNPSVVSPDKVTNLTQTFFTEYQVTNPKPYELLTLGTETITFEPGSTANKPGSPVQGVVIPTVSTK
jgi:hypothetical protein